MSSVALALRDERLRLHGAATRTGSVASLALAGVLLVVAGRQVPGAWTALWLAALGLALLLRMLAWRWHRRHPGQPDRALLQYRLSFLGHGLAWSLVAAALLPPHTEAAHDALLLAVVGIGASSMIGASFDVRAVALFAVPPLAIASLAMGLGGRGSELVMVLMFIALTALGMRRAHAALVERMALRDSVEAQAQRGRLLDRMLDTTPQGFAFVDAQARVARINPALGEWLGVEAAQLAGRGLDALPGSVAQALAPLLAQARDRGRAEGEIDHQRRGERLAALVTVTSLGPEQGLVAVWTDISARRHVERELQMHRAVTNSITDLVSVIDESRHYRLVNEAWCRATGIAMERAV
ncbi:MAG: PAS domain-containing protein, partial [Rubrivivax sp.]|nr:PAS domain-containing protein [Rubrivivax sp.]